jgi:hypothetical protein
MRLPRRRGFVSPRNRGYLIRRQPPGLLVISISRSVFDPDWGAYKSERFSYLIFQEALI